MKAFFLVFKLVETDVLTWVSLSSDGLTREKECVVTRQFVQAFESELQAICALPTESDCVFELVKVFSSTMPSF